MRIDDQVGALLDIDPVSEPIITPPRVGNHPADSGNHGGIAFGDNINPPVKPGFSPTGSGSTLLVSEFGEVGATVILGDPVAVPPGPEGCAVRGSVSQIRGIDLGYSPLCNQRIHIADVGVDK